MRHRMIKKIGIILIGVLFANSVNAQIAYRMNLKAFGGYQFGQDLKSQDGGIPENLENKSYTIGGEFGYYTNENLNINLNIKQGKYIYDVSERYDYVTISLGLNYLFMPNSKINPYMFGALNYSDIFFVGDAGFAFGGSLGCGALINFRTRFGFFSQVGYHYNGYNSFTIEAGLYFKFLRSVK